MNIDLNNIKEYGSYYCNGNSAAQTFKNIPVLQAFTLKVSSSVGIKSTYVTQEFLSVRGEKYIRTYDTYINGGTWSPWKKYVLNSDFTYENILVDTIANQSVEIIGAPTAPNYIPTITSVGSTLTYYSSFTYLDNAKKWYIYSNVSQQVRVIFYKLPSSK